MKAMSGRELMALRKALGIRTQPELSALLHFMAGGPPPAVSTISRQERLPVASSTELVAFLRLLELVVPRPSDGSVASVMPLEDYLALRTGQTRTTDSAAAADTDDDGAADWRESILDHLRKGHRLDADILGSESDQDFLLQLVRLAPGLAAQHLFRLGYGPQNQKA